MIKEILVESLGQFITQVEEISNGEDVTWYRGIGSITYKLLPSLYRHPSIKDSGTLINQEDEILKRFKQRSIPYINRATSDDWDLFFIMQHFGVPTRLLDWSENPFVSLYFALSGAQVDTNYEYIDNVVVWVLNPRLWNKKALSDVSIDSILSPDDPMLLGYKFKQSSRMRANPVAIFGNHNSSRIVAQKGAFMLFGSRMESMEDIFIKDNYDLECLFKINIPSTSIKSMLKSLVKIGVTDSVIFPDLDGLAKEIKRTYNYPV